MTTGGEEEAGRNERYTEKLTIVGGRGFFIVHAYRVLPLSRAVGGISPGNGKLPHARLDGAAS